MPMVNDILVCCSHIDVKRNFPKLAPSEYSFLREKRIRSLTSQNYSEGDGRF